MNEQFVSKSFLLPRHGCDLKCNLVHIFHLQYIDRQADGSETDGETDSETDSEADRQTDSETDRQMESNAWTYGLLTS